MKKGYFIVTFILLMVFLLTNVSFGAIDATASFVPDKTQAKKGEYVTLTFAVNTQNEFNGFEGYLTYDEDFFSDVSVISDYSLNSGQGFKDGDSFISIENSDTISGGTLFTVKLKVNDNTTKENGEIQLSSLSVYTVDDDGELEVSPITVNLINSGNNQENKNEQQNIITDGNEEQDNNVEEQNFDTATTPLPATGKAAIIMIAIITLAGVGIFAIVRFKNIIK